MSYIIDIGGAPANEDCAQLGQTPDFEAVNTFEVLAYKLAIIARHGMPPAGCKLGPHTNRHDFGVYGRLPSKSRTRKTKPFRRMPRP
jgi:hypothetical protein